MPADRFLERMADLLLRDGPEGLGDLAVVLPSRRAALFLRRELAARAGRAVWSPAMLTMDTLLEAVSGRRILPDVDLLLHLVEVHRNVAGEQAEPADEFLNWAPTLLRDMSEVDGHLLDLERFYADLSALQGIEEWSLRLGASSPGQRRLLRYWELAGRIHRAFEEQQQRMEAGHAGHVAREAVARVRGGALPPPWRKVWFAGLNALTPAEQAVVKGLQALGLAELAWDTDRYFLDDPRQESGHFLRRHLHDLGAGQVPPVNELLERDRRVHVRALPDPLSMAIEAGRLLGQLAPEERERTTVVLADNGLLLPFLQHLPVSVGPLNVTMSVPLQALPVHGLVGALHQVLLSLVEMRGPRLNELERLFLHPFLRGVEGHEAVIAGLRTARSHRPSREQLQEALSQLADHDRQVWMDCLAPVGGNGASLADRTLAVIELARQGTEEDTLENEQLYQLALSVGRARSALARLGEELGPVRWLRAFDRLFRDQGIGLYGEPLRGVQVMGMLETRLLEHDRLIVVSADEGTLPAGGTGEGFIPFDVRRTHGLPLRHEHDAVSAFHFLQALRRAKEVVLLHQGASAGDGQGPSRFVLQVEEELAVPERSNTTLEADHRQARVPVRIPAIPVVSKDQALLERLSAMLLKGMPPTRLASFLSCPLDLYFRHVLKLREPEEVSAGIAPDVIGQAVHNALEEVLGPSCGRELMAAPLQEAAGSVREVLHRHLSVHLPRERLEEGEPRLQLEMAASAAEAFLRNEAKRCTDERTELLKLEDDVWHTLDLPVRGLEGKARFGGRIDRVDRREGITHIIDLKTGSVDPRLLSLPTPEADLFAERTQALQLLVYAWTYLGEHPGLEAVRAAIVPLQRTSKSEPIVLKVAGRDVIERDLLPSIDGVLAELAGRLLDPAIPFSHRAESRYCGFCVPS